MTNQNLRPFFVDLPKIELHRHLEGSLRLDTMVDVALHYGVDLPIYTTEGLRPFVQITADDPRDSAHFLKKFSMLRSFFRAPEIIQRAAREAVLDVAEDNIRYLE